MDTRRFDALVQRLSVADSRRRLLTLLATLPVVGALLGLLPGQDMLGKDRRRRRKQRHRKRKHAGTRKKTCTPKSKGKVCAGRCGEVKIRTTCGKRVDCGPCTCTPACPVCQTCDAESLTCVAQCTADESCCEATCVDTQSDPDNCGGCGNRCGTNTICVAGACQPCDVTCTGSAADCGLDLRLALQGSKATLYVCPGTYQGGFSIGRSLTVIGAGEGESGARSTVLEGSDTQRVLDISSGTVMLERLRISGGNAGADSGGGIRNTVASLTLRDCTVAGNTARNGAGIWNTSGMLEMIRCTVRDNTWPLSGGAPIGGGLLVSGAANLTDCLILQNSTGGIGGGIAAVGASVVQLAGDSRIEGNTANSGGGIHVYPRASITIGAGCRVTGNTAPDGAGGGIYTAGGVVTLQGTADPSPVVVDNCHDNCAGLVDVAKCQSGGRCLTP